jgi:ABC-type branched-subunit amino acid transport system substrate-binding protein
LGGSARKSSARRLVAGVAATAIALGALVAPAGAKAKKVSGEPLKFAYLDFSAGAGATPQLDDAIQAYVKDWNNRGGFKGQPIQVTTYVTGFDAGLTVTAVQDSVEQGVTAFLASGFCQVSRGPIEAAGLSVFAGDAMCYDPSFMPAPTGTGGLVAMIDWAREDGAKHFGVLYPNFPGFKENIAGSLEGYAEVQGGIDVTAVGLPYPYTGADLDAVIARFKAAGVDALYMSGQPSDVNLQLEKGRIQSFGPEDGIRWIFGPNVYDPNFLADVPAAEGTYTLSFYYPWQDTANPIVKNALKVTRDLEVRDGFAGIGYAAAANLEAILKKHKDKRVTAESFLATALAQHKFALPFQPLTVDLADLTKNPSGGQILKAVNGKYVVQGDYRVFQPEDYTVD